MMERSVSVLLVVILTAAGCSGGGARPSELAGVATPPGVVADDVLRKAVSRSPDARMRPGGDPHVVRVFGPEGPDSALFYGYRPIEDEGCRRWAGGIRRAAEDAKTKDESARVAGADFGDAQGRAAGVALLVAQPSMLDELASGSPDQCSGTWAEDQGRRIRIQVAEVPTQPLGDQARAYRVWRSGRAATWFKEVRFGPYMLQVAHVGDVFYRTPPDPITAQKLDVITARAYRQAREILDHAPTSSAASLSPLPTARFAPDPPGMDIDVRLTEAMLPSFRGAHPERSRSIVPSGAHVGDGPLLTTERWMKKVAFTGMDRSQPCTRYAEGLWTAAGLASPPPDVVPQVGFTALERPDGFFTTQFLVWATPQMIDTLTGRPPPGECRSFTGTIDGKEADLKVSPVEAAPIAAASWAYKITTSGDAPSYVKWFRFGPYIAEVRIGTIGTKPNDDVTTKTLDEAARAAYTRALETLT